MANQTEKSATLDRPLENERLASLVRSVRILAHEIGNPLNNMYLEALLLEGRLRQTRARGAEVTRAAQIVTEIRRLIRLLEEFRQTSPVKAVPMAECDLVEICEYAALQLVIAKQIVTSHHGTINCDSVPGYGTTFRITLPLVAT